MRIIEPFLGISPLARQASDPMKIREYLSIISPRILESETSPGNRIKIDGVSPFSISNFSISKTSSARFV